MRKVVPFEEPKKAETVRKWYRYASQGMNIEETLNEVEREGLTPFQILREDVPTGFYDDVKTVYIIVCYRDAPRVVAGHPSALEFKPGGVI
jgi:hypothetical protein